MHFSDRVDFVLRLDGQRYIDPGAYVAALAAAVISRGGTLRTGFSVRSLRHGPGGVAVTAYGREPERADVVVLATGSWLHELARPLGVRVPMRAGRGYSFSVEVSEAVQCPLYFPALRVACTPYGDGMRVGGTMEFRSADSPLDEKRVLMLRDAATPLLRGVDWASLRDIWVGPRPVTADGLAVVGPTRAPGVYVAGGHGMWGITLGPITGRLLALSIATGGLPEALGAFNALR